VAVVFGLLAAILLGTSILIFMNGSLWSEAHPILRIGVSLVALFLGVTLFRYAIEVYLTTDRTTIHIAAEGFIYNSNGGSLWSSWDNAARIERLFINNRWLEGITLRAPATVAGRTLGFTVFSTKAASWLSWDRFIPLSPFGDLWRTRSVPDLKDIEPLAQLARMLLPAHSIPSTPLREGALYQDIRRNAPHLFTNE